MTTFMSSWCNANKIFLRRPAKTNSQYHDNCIRIVNIQDEKAKKPKSHSLFSAFLRFTSWNGWLVGVIIFELFFEEAKKTKIFKNFANIFMNVVWMLMFTHTHTKPNVKSSRYINGDTWFLRCGCPYLYEHWSR